MKGRAITQPGYYWYRPNSSIVPEICRVVKDSTIKAAGKNCVLHVLFIACGHMYKFEELPGDFYGPIQSPGEELWDALVAAIADDPQ